MRQIGYTQLQGEEEEGWKRYDCIVCIQVYTRYRCVLESLCTG